MAGGIRENSGDELSENHEINVTPFIDVMLGLAFASLITWTVWLAKTLELAGARARVFMEVMNLLRDAGYLKIALVGLEGVPAAAGPTAGAATTGPAAGSTP